MQSRASVAMMSLKLVITNDDGATRDAPHPQMLVCLLVVVELDVRPVVKLVVAEHDVVLENRVPLL